MSDNRTFVSYSRADSQFAVKLASDLRANGASIWLDQLDIAPGARWDSAIEDALRRSACVIVLLSPTAAASQNVLDEVSFALDEGKTIVPVLVEACSVPMRLRRLQHVDFTPGYEAALGRLLVTLGVAPTSVSSGAMASPEPASRVPPPADATPEPPLREPLRDPAIPSTGPASGQRTMLFAGVAAAVVVFAVLAVWLSSRSDDVTDSPAEAVVSSAPAGTTAPDDTTAPPPTASAPAHADTKVSPAPDAPAQSAGGSAESGPFNTRPLEPGAGADDAGLKTLLDLTRSMERLDTLTETDLEQLAEALLLACRGNPSPACEATKSGYLDSLLTTVCGRSLGAWPSDETAAHSYEAKLESCRLAYMNILETQMHLKDPEALRKIKAGLHGSAPLPSPTSRRRGVDAARGGEQVGQGEQRHQRDGHAAERLAVGDGHLA
jgi:hypothetical protein